MDTDAFAVYPMVPAEDISVRKAILQSSPYGWLELAALAGETIESGEPAFMVSHEVPRTEGSIRTKQEQEIDDVRAFLKAWMAPQYLGELTAGEDPNLPPDCIAEVLGRRIGVETAQLLLPAKRGGGNSIGKWHVFEQLKNRLLKESGKLESRLGQHQGYMVTVWFNPQGESRLPPKSRGVDELVEFLEIIRPPSQSMLDSLGARGAPKTIPADTVMQHNEDQSIGCTWTPLPATFRSGFRTALGFDLGLAYHETYTRSELRDELKRVARQHDDSRSEILLITIAACTRSGMNFPSSALLADSLFNDPFPLGEWAPSHIGTIVIHDARNGRLRCIHGELPFNDHGVE